MPQKLNQRNGPIVEPPQMFPHNGGPNMEAQKRFRKRAPIPDPKRNRSSASSTFAFAREGCQNKHLPSGPNCPPREPMQGGGRGRTSPPALSDVDIRMPKIADSNPKRPTPARENSTFFRTVSRDAERCRNRCKRTQPTREPQPIWHPTKSRTVSPGTASGSGRHLPKRISKKRKNVPESAPVMDP